MGSRNRPFAYIEVDRSVAPVESRLAAAAVLRYAVRALGLAPPPRIRWFLAAEAPVKRGDALFAELARLIDPDVPQMDWLARQATGFLSPLEVSGVAFRAERDAVWVQADLPGTAPHAAKLTAFVVLHECRHRHQQQAGQWPLTGTKAAIEADADEWARAHLAAALAEAAG